MRLKVTLVDHPTVTLTISFLIDITGCQISELEFTS